MEIVDMKDDCFVKMNLYVKLNLCVMSNLYESVKSDYLWTMTLLWELSLWHSHFNAAHITHCKTQSLTQITLDADFADFYTFGKTNN